MSVENRKDANENVDALHRGPTRRQFLTGMAAAGAGVVVSTSGTAGAASLVSRGRGGTLAGADKIQGPERRPTHSCSGGCSRCCLLLRLLPTRSERRFWRWACPGGSLMPR